MDSVACSSRGVACSASVEHASVASFARGTLELMALGAPLHLVERMQAAAQDEVRHARLSLAIARRLERGETGPLVVDESLDAAFGPLPALPVRSSSFATVAVDTLLEAAVPETLGAFAAEVAARACRDDVIAGVVAEIAADEARHAALAWDSVQWCIDKNEEARAAVVAAVSSLSAPVTSPSQGTSDDLGLLSPDSEVRAWRMAFDERVLPRVRSLLGELQRGGAVA